MAAPSPEEAIAAAQALSGNEGKYDIDAPKKKPPSKSKTYNFGAELDRTLWSSFILTAISQ